MAIKIEPLNFISHNMRHQWFLCRTSFQKWGRETHTMCFATAGSARQDCTSRLTDQKGAIMHMDYAAYDNCSWTIQVQPQHVVNIGIRYTLHMTQHDVITVYEGPSMRSRILYRLYQHSAKAGYRHSVNVQSTGSNLTVNFQSGDMPGNGIGFVATYTGEPFIGHVDQLISSSWVVRSRKVIKIFFDPAKTLQTKICCFALQLEWF